MRAREREPRWLRRYRKPRLSDFARALAEIYGVPA